MRTEQQALPATFTPDRMGGAATQALASQIEERITAQVRGYRGKLARAEGAAAAARGDDAAAGEAYVRSALLAGGPVIEDAAAWFATRYDLAPAAVERALGRTRVTEPAAVSWPVAIAYTQGPLAGHDTLSETAADDDKKIKTDDITDYKLKRGYDRGYVFVGALPYQVKTTAGTRTVGMLGLVVGFAPFSNKTNYGAVVRDDLGYKLGVGYRTGDGLGSKESRLVWGFEGFYRLMAGMRTHHVALTAGAGLGWLRLSAGDTLAKGWHAEPVAELALRAIGTYNVTIDVSGFAGTIGSLGRTDRVSLVLPFDPGTGVGLFASYESTNVTTKSTMDDGTDVALGKQAAKLYIVGIGGNY